MKNCWIHIIMDSGYIIIKNRPM
uniref:Uncharacterized protein n=1 Tax=Anguilla anguilla TaxID=7936 RepID=A0A0E9SJE9_ANGAN